jgi:hypothetical protein
MLNTAPAWNKNVFMLNSSDQATYRSIRELKRIIGQSNKPLVFWIGAGASRWLGYPLWVEFARELRREFFLYVAEFDNNEALKLIDAGAFPDFFQRCRALDRARYYRFLSSAFLPRPETDLYKRFVDALSKLIPLRILTTNIDESLEHHFSNAALFQGSDFTGCIEQLQVGGSFIVKMHGSRSAIESTVFTRPDYEKLKENSGFINTLRSIFTLSTVIFIGYSVSDQYIVDLLSENHRDMSLFGAGPHFVVSPQVKETLNLRHIGYSLRRFPDHRSALTVLDLIRQAEQRKAEPRVEKLSEPTQRSSEMKDAVVKTAYYISDFLPVGTWNTSTTAKLQPKNGLKPELTVGLGFTNAEIPAPPSTAAHDLLVGLICFDFAYFSLLMIGRVHELVGSTIFWELVDLDAIRFIHLQHEPAFVAEEGAPMGGIGLVSVSSSSGKPESAGAVVRRQLLAAAGKESEYERLISGLEDKITVFDEAGRIDLAELVRASAMMPEVSRLLGIGEAILPTQTPRWLLFSYLRMAHLVHTGAVCSALKIHAAKIPFGSAKLMSAAFGVQRADESADDYARYTLSGRFDCDLGSIFYSEPDIIRKILKFRTSSEGEAFRKEVRAQLLENEAGEFTASINAGLKKNIPAHILQKARDKVSSLFTERITVSPVPAVWTNPAQSDDTTKFWRANSERLLLKMARERGISNDDECICGSGDMLRRCCLPPLRN